ncbi:MAG: hypothetical protein GWN84_02045 [Gammaproteobacteria bacterium]|nr:hypothetical protein [Gammaproteobacteria bacterium]NIU52061.1 hypothetical protein [Gemmatimonadota bacterium]NIR81943.1 hypothetical protein [Gammaproteobacteria bacterium]NIU03045.1 hypothetical protein [Gammaproteobacteria bacterium]NIV50569.1 hypothetical protein [Gammaproteobacteria bacterium]
MTIVLLLVGVIGLLVGIITSILAGEWDVGVTAIVVGAVLMWIADVADKRAGAHSP